VIRFGVFEFDLKNGELRREGVLVRLKPQPLKLLSLLVSQAGDVVGRDQIQERLWAPGTFIDYEQGVNHCIRQIRLALNDDAVRPRYVQTLPRRGYRFLLVPEMADARNHRSGPNLELDRRVLAVLPFENLSGDCREDYLGDGLTDELITQLGRARPEALGVVSRGSVRGYRNSHKPVAEVGRELGADYILEGSARRSLDRVRICAQLVDAEHQTHLWAEPYERPLGDVLGMQCEVAQAIASQILLVLTPKQEPPERFGLWDT
jgi:TolB-like protein